MSKLVRLLSCIVPMLAQVIPALADELYAVTPSGATEAIFASGSKDAVARLSNRCIDARWSVVRSSETELICEIPLGTMQSALGQFLLGNTYSSPPRMLVRFNAHSLNGLSRVQALGWMEVQMALGQINKQDLSDPESQNRIIKFLLSAGGHYPVGTTFPNHAVMGVTGEFTTNGRSTGYLVREVEPASPAAVAGIQTSDLIVRVASKQFKDDATSVNALAKAAKTSIYKVDLLRNGTPLSLELARAFRPTVTEEPKPLALSEVMPVGTGSAIPASIADELAKFAKLRDDKILTEEEFQTRKAKLLAQ